MRGAHAPPPPSAAWVRHAAILTTLEHPHVTFRHEPIRKHKAALEQPKSALRCVQWHHNPCCVLCCMQALLP